MERKKCGKDDKNGTKQASKQGKARQARTNRVLAHRLAKAAFARRPDASRPSSSRSRYASLAWHPGGSVRCYWKRSLHPGSGRAHAAFTKRDTGAASTQGGRTSRRWVSAALRWPTAARRLASASACSRRTTAASALSSEASSRTAFARPARFASSS